MKYFAKEGRAGQDCVQEKNGREYGARQDFLRHKRPQQSWTQHVLLEESIVNSCVALK